MKVFLFVVTSLITCYYSSAQGNISQYQYSEDEDRSYLYLGFSYGLGLATNIGDQPDNIDVESEFTFLNDRLDIVNTVAQFKMLYLFDRERDWGLDSHFGITSESINNVGTSDQDFKDDDFYLGNYRFDIAIGVYYYFFSLGLEYSFPIQGYFDSDQLLDDEIVELTSLVTKVYIPVFNRNNKQIINIFLQGKYGLNGLYPKQLNEYLYTSDTKDYVPASIHIGVSAMINVLRYFN